MNDWTNAIKGAVGIIVTALMDVILGIMVIAGLDVDKAAWAALTTSLNVLVGGIFLVWILFTHKNSPIRVTDDVRREQPLVAADATRGGSATLAPPPAA